MTQFISVASGGSRCTPSFVRRDQLLANVIGVLAGTCLLGDVYIVAFIRGFCVMKVSSIVLT